MRYSGAKMKSLRGHLVAVLLIHAVCAWCGDVPLRLVQTIALPDVQGRLDHLAVDVKGRRLFVAGLGNNSLEVIDLKSGRRTQSVPGMSKPQGVLFVPQSNKLYVANGADGTLKLLKGAPLSLTSTIKLELGADLVDYDARTKRLYIGYGGKDAGKEYGQFGIIDTVKDTQVGDIRTSAHPGGIAVERNGPLLFLTIPDNDQVLVINRQSQNIVSTWPTSDAKQPVSVALDEKHRRLLLGLRKPPRLAVIDIDSGKTVSSMESIGLIDGVSWDSARNRVYVSGGEGFIAVYQQKDANNYEMLGRVPTGYMARTSLFVPELNRLYVALPKMENRQAEIRVYEPVP